MIFRPFLLPRIARQRLAENWHKSNKLTSRRQSITGFVQDTCRPVVGSVSRSLTSRQAPVTNFVFDRVYLLTKGNRSRESPINVPIRTRVCQKVARDELALMTVLKARPPTNKIPEKSSRDLGIGIAPQKVRSGLSTERYPKCHVIH